MKVPLRKLLVTSWSDAGYKQYGHLFLKGWKEHWSDVPLVVFHEGTSPETEGPLYFDLREDRGLTTFLGMYGSAPAANGIGKLPDGRLVIDYRWQAVKFARKVFAIASGKIPQADWRIWIDADIVFKKAPTEAFWQETTPDQGGYAGSFLGRIDWHHSECGWVAYKMPECQGFLDRFREIYENGDVFRFPEWHDSFIFDQLRYNEDILNFKNLADGVRGMHPWPETVLGEFMDHHKGPVAKKEFYG